jgi:hypothetical protein
MGTDLPRRGRDPPTFSRGQQSRRRSAGLTNYHPIALEAATFALTAGECSRAVVYSWFSPVLGDYRGCQQIFNVSRGTFFPRADPWFSFPNWLLGARTDQRGAVGLRPKSGRPQVTAKI